LRFAQKKSFDYAAIERFLLEVEKLKSSGNLSDSEILIRAFKRS
jgi:hypothetical protein